MSSVLHPTTALTDFNVDPSTTHSYTVRAYDATLNWSANSPPQSVTTLHPSAGPLDTGGSVDYMSTWGAGPEKIALLTGVLSLRLPLLKLQHRSRGPGFGLIASANSGFWTSDTTGTRMSAIDTGFGLGVNVMVGAMYPIYSGNLLVRYEFLDSAGSSTSCCPPARPTSTSPTTPPTCCGTTRPAR